MAEDPEGSAVSKQCPWGNYMGTYLLPLPVRPLAAGGGGPGGGRGCPGKPCERDPDVREENVRLEKAYVFCKARHLAPWKSAMPQSPRKDRSGVLCCRAGEHGELNKVGAPHL